MSADLTGVGARIHNARVSKGWTLAEVSRRLDSEGLRRGTSVNHLSQVEHGKSRASEELLVALESVLDANFHALHADDQFEDAQGIQAQPLTPTRKPTLPAGPSTRDESYVAALERLLLRADSAVVITWPSLQLAPTIERALRRRKENGQTFWDSLVVVMPQDGTLRWVHDDLSADFPDPGEASRAREYRAAQCRRRVMSLLLRSGHRDRWSIHTCSFVPSVVGALLTMPDGTHETLLEIARPRRSADDSRCVLLADSPDGYLLKAFRDVTERSVEEHEVVLVGDLRGSEFVFRGARFRRSVMLSGNHVQDWLAAILVITWANTNVGPQPMLQINTPTTSTRELGKLSHLSGYVTLQDCAPDFGAADQPAVLPQEIAEAAVWRELITEMRVHKLRSGPELVDRIAFHYGTTESLFFLVYVAEFEDGQPLPADALMASWSLDELIRLRRHQVFRNILAVLRTGEITDVQRRLAAQGLTLNLELQGDVDLLDEAVHCLQPTASTMAAKHFRATVEDRLRDSVVERVIAGRRYGLSGLAGLQYRTFFDCLLPAYAAAGVPGASDVLREVESGPRADARERLSRFYSDATTQDHLQIEV